MKRLKICHVLYGLGVGGIETLAVKLCNRMDRDRFEHIIISLTPVDELEPELEPGAAKVFYFDKGPGTDVRVYPGLVRVMRRERPDVVHTRNWATLLEGVVPSLMAGVPGRLHSFDGMNADDVGSERRARVLAQRILLPRVDKVVARSEAMRDAMCARLGLDPANVALIADGIDLARFDRPTNRRDTRARFGLSEKDIVVGIVARLDPVKDHASLLDAMVSAVRAVPELKLLVVGDGPLADQLEKRAAALPCSSHIVFAGQQLDVPSLYRAMDLYAQPSLYEGVSGAILEAMAARLPVVTTPVGGTVDIVADGVNGLLVPVQNPAALAEALVRVARDPGLAQRLGDAGRKVVERRFSLDRVLRQYARAYAEAAGVLES